MVRRLRGIPYRGMEPESSLQYMTSSIDGLVQISSPEQEELVAWDVGTQDMAREICKANEL